jgi:hypothetical protein
MMKEQNMAANMAAAASSQPRLILAMSKDMVTFP